MLYAEGRGLLAEEGTYDLGKYSHSIGDINAPTPS